MDILTEARRALEVAGYSTKSSSLENALIFEDESLAGFVWVAPDVASILKSWRERQSEFLRENDERLRKSKKKSWNIYSVLLAQADPSPEQENQLAAVEEDFIGTRKIARAGLQTSARMPWALLPLLPLQNLVLLREEDAFDQLRARLSAVPVDLLDAILGSATPKEIALILGRTRED